MNALIARLFDGSAKEPPPALPAPVPQPKIDTDQLAARWGEFVEQYVSAYGLPLLILSNGPGRVTAFSTLADLEDFGVGELCRLTEPEAVAELTAEWSSQLGTGPAKRDLVAELQKTDEAERPAITFVYPEHQAIGADFSAWASAQAEADAIRDRANKDAIPQGAVIFARLSGAQELEGWENEKTRQHRDRKAEQLVQGVMRILAVEAKSPTARPKGQPSERKAR